MDALRRPLAAAFVLLALSFSCIPWRASAQEEGEAPFDVDGIFPDIRFAVESTVPPYDTLTYNASFQSPKGTYEVTVEPGKLLFFDCSVSGALTQEHDEAENSDKFVKLGGSIEYEDKNHYITCKAITNILEPSEVDEEYEVTLTVTAENHEGSTASALTMKQKLTAALGIAQTPVLKKTQDVKKKPVRMKAGIEEWPADYKYERGVYAVRKKETPWMAPATASSSMPDVRNGTIPDGATLTPEQSYANAQNPVSLVGASNVMGFVSPREVLNSYMYLSASRYFKASYHEETKGGTRNCYPSGVVAKIGSGPAYTYKQLARIRKVELKGDAVVNYVTFPEMPAYPKQKGTLDAFSDEVRAHEEGHFNALKNIVENDMSNAVEGGILNKALGSLKDHYAIDVFTVPSTPPVPVSYPSLFPPPPPPPPVAAVAETVTVGSTCEEKILEEVSLAQRDIIGTHTDTNPTITKSFYEHSQKWDSPRINFCMHWDESPPPARTSCSANTLIHNGGGTFFGITQSSPNGKTVSIDGGRLVMTKTN